MEKKAEDLTLTNCKTILSLYSLDKFPHSITSLQAKMPQHRRIIYKTDNGSFIGQHKHKHGSHTELATILKLMRDGWMFWLADNTEKVIQKKLSIESSVSQS